MKLSHFLLLLAFIVSTDLSAQKNLTVDFKKLDKYYSKMVEDWDIPSASIGIVKDGKLVFAGNYGVLEEGKAGKPNKHTLYAIASNSKAFTSALIGMLVQEGKLSWDDKVKDYLPYFELYDPWVSNQVTIRDILSHRVGLGTFSGDVIWYKSGLSAEEVVKRAKYVPQTGEFRASYGYSNLMYIAAGEVIRAVTGKSWAVNVKERIFDPLQMNRTITSPKKLDSKGNYATPHARQDEKNIPVVWEDWEEIGALGGIITSVSDISKWMIFNLNHGILGSDTLLTAYTRNTVWTPHNNRFVDHTFKNDLGRHFRSYGLGWGLSDYYGNLRVEHTGGYDGMITALTLVPDQNLGVVVLTNGMKSPIRAASNYALDLFTGIEPRDWSEELLKLRNIQDKSDSRVANRKAKRVLGTQPSISLKELIGTYRSDIYGEILVSDKNGKLKIDFEHAPDLSATLSHWNYDVWEIKWGNRHAWFDFGTVKFNTNNELKVTGMDFDVPNDDIFFEELKPYKVD